MVFSRSWHKTLCRGRRLRWSNSNTSNANNIQESFDIGLWLSRVQGDVNFYATQLLTGHGNFQLYLHRFKLSDILNCPDCEGCTEQFDSERHCLCVMLKQS